MAHPFSRRDILRGAAALSTGVMASGLGLDGLLHAFAAEPQPDKAGASSPLLLFFYFSGGWDTILSLDPRSNTAYGADDGIWPAYDLVAKNDGEVAKVLQATNGSGVQKAIGSNVNFGPAVGRLANHWQDVCIVRGMSMGTLSHEVGYRFFMTGKFPTGLRARGSSLGTWFAAQTGDNSPVPNLVVGMETYNEGLPLYANGLQVNSAQQILTVVSQLGTKLPASSEAALQAFLAQPDCGIVELDGEGAATTYLAARQKAMNLVSGPIPKAFTFSATPDAELAKLYKALHIEPAKIVTELGGPKGRAAIAVQALTQGASQAVGVRLVDGLDTHYADWQVNQARRQREGWDAVADVISYLKETLDKSGKPFWDRTVLLCASEFARTPKINSRGGRDHHLGMACLLAGKGIAGNRVIGATSDAQYGAQPIHLLTGQLDSNGTVVRPTDVHATLLKAAGLAYTHLTNVSPKIVQAALKA
ncbi:MAG: DUF1501 domain-containing protein [Myxococcales bacterium]|nr:DUF1501 domain-containing protein [Myxococcales bacterium]